ncbi:hypothetical protein ACFSX9_03185 [Flavobacterium ardleyense]|uniref:DUF3300 domain-containing protein n=1 Tax=Flavobacterium ardleyense TaxID=2038737 RepID=A0ABW5Z6G0_9FLAO
MRTKILTLSAITMLSITSLVAQDKTTVRAKSADISDNLDLRAIATVFGDASNLEDFENRINDPKAQISNLDLNNDNYVDYLRVIESVEGNAHLVIVQAVLEKDVYQDVATIEVQKDRNNKVQVQVVGDVYMYGENYIYEPVYVHNPVIYTTFWVTNYRPYYSSWHWNYYPSYYTYWAPYPIYRYRNNVHIHINYGHSYHYVTNRRCQVAYSSYYGRRGNGYETRYPNRSFSHRNAGYANRQELDNNRRVNSPRGRNEMAGTNSRNSDSNGTRGNREANSSPRTREANGSRDANTTPRTREANVTRDANTNPRTRTAEVSSTRNESTPRANSTRTETNSPRQREANVATRTNTPRNSPRAESPRSSSEPRASAPRAENQRSSSPTRSSAPSAGNQRSSSQSSPKMSSPRGDSGQRNSSQRSDSGSRSSGSRTTGRG